MDLAASWYTASTCQMRGCLDDQEILAWVAGTLTAEQHAQCLAHVGTCGTCRVLVSETSKSPEGQAEAAEQSRDAVLPSGTQVGRYELRSLLGFGGAGFVYDAFDPQLSRRVALKLVRPDAHTGQSDGNSAARLLREARAMARLSHPNVVTVFDAGEFDGGVFIAMELVEGRTLSTWLRDEKPSPQAIGTLFLEAGRGLEAAHVAGLIHRDFKPENVLLGRDDRPRVTDFGLARVAELSHDDRVSLEEPDERDPEPLRSMLLTMTRAGVLAGTPAYMAPEQFQGARTDAATDQFNFCASLFLALYDRLPFSIAGQTHTTLASLARAVTIGEIRPPKNNKVPRSVLSVLMRGLSIDPAARYPSMTGLLAALHHAFRSTWPRRLFAVSALAGVLALFVGLSMSTSTPKPSMKTQPVLAPVIEETRQPTDAAIEIKPPKSTNQYKSTPRKHSRPLKMPPRPEVPRQLGDGLKDPYGAP